MKRILTALLAMVASAALAQQSSPADAALARMRDAMKKLTQRIAEADAATANAQAAQFAAEAKTKELEGQLKTTTNNLKDETAKRKADKEASDKAIKDLETRIAAKDKQIADFTKAMTDWQAFGKKAEAAFATSKDELAEAKGKAILLERQVQEHERKNREMYKLGVEILDRYKNFGLGTALLAKEPFTGSMRVKFQNYVQDYGDKLDTQRIKPAAGKDVGAPTPEKPGQAAKP